MSDQTAHSAPATRNALMTIAFVSAVLNFAGLSYIVDNSWRQLSLLI